MEEGQKTRLATVTIQYDTAFYGRGASCFSFSSEIESSGVVGRCPISTQPSDSIPHCERKKKLTFPTIKQASSVP